MAIARAPQNSPLDDGIRISAFEPNFAQTGDRLFVQRKELGYPKLDYDIERMTADNLLVNRTIATCRKYKLEFSKLSTIQRKFITHYRCSQCGLLPLYKISLLHVKRVRCGNCGQLIGFTRKGKYGKLRKEIAIEVVKELQGGPKLARQ
jgi:hypothetical protein